MSTFDISLCLVALGFFPGFIAGLWLMALITKWFIEDGQLKQTEKWFKK